MISWNRFKQSIGSASWLKKIIGLHMKTGKIVPAVRPLIMGNYRYRIITGLSLILFGVTFLLTVTFVFYEHGVQYRDLKRDGNVMISELCYLSTLALQTDNFSILDNRIQQLVNDPAVQYLFVYDKNLEVLIQHQKISKKINLAHDLKETLLELGGTTAGKKEQINLNLSDLVMIKKKPGFRLEFFAPIISTLKTTDQETKYAISSTTALGAVQLGLSTKTIILEQRHIMRDSFIVLLLFLPLAILALMFIERRITIPLKRMKNWALSIGRGEFDLAIEFTGDDELSELAKNLQKMALQLRKRFDIQSALLEISATISSSRDLDLILTYLANKLLQLIPVDIASIRLFNEEKGTLDAGGKAGLLKKSKEEIAQIQAKVEGDQLLEAVFLQKEPVFIFDALQSPKLKPEIVNFFEMKSILVVPLLIHNKVMGVIFLLWCKGKHYLEEEEKQIAVGVANYAAIAIENANLFKDLGIRATRSRLIQEISSALLSTLELEEIYQIVIVQMHRALPFDRFAVAIYDELKGGFQMRWFWPVDSASFSQKGEFVALSDTYLTREAFQKGQPIVCDDLSQIAHEHPRVEFLVKEGYRSHVVVPILAEKTKLGVFTLSRKESHSFTNFEVDLLQSVAAHLALALQNAALYENQKKAYRDLVLAQEQLVSTEKLRALGELATEVAHDFNNILGAIMARAQLLMVSELDPQQDRNVKMIDEAAQDGAQIVKRIQEFTRIRKGIDLFEVNINQIVIQAYSMSTTYFKSLGEERFLKIKFDLKLADQDLIIQGNPAELREVFINIIHNAADAIEEGGTITIRTLKYSTPNKAVAHSIAIEEQLEYVSIEFQDTGIGMSEEVKAKIFDPFFTTKGKHGTGLGMSIAFGIITRHKGRIEIETEPAKGCLIRILIPTIIETNLIPEKENKSQEAKTDNTTYSNSEIACAASAKLLIIDDEKNLLKMLEEIFLKEGYQVVIAEDGELGIKLFEQNKFDLVITDLGLPGISGWEIAKKVKEKNPNTPVVVFSGWGEQIELRKKREFKIDLVISKPFRIDDVVGSIEKLLAVAP